MNVLLIGHRQHGKTDVGALLAKVLNTTAHDSSWFACERVVYPVLKEKYGYTNPQECYDDRQDHRHGRPIRRGEQSTKRKQRLGLLSSYDLYGNDEFSDSKV